MILSARNNFFKGGIVLAALSLALSAAGGYFAFPACPAATAAAGFRPQGIIQGFVEGLAKPSAYVPFWTMLGSVVYSLISIILIHYFFEKTQSPEILFFGFFVISLSFEFIRIIVPLRGVFPFLTVYLAAASRILLFGRYFGLFSLFAASVYAAGLDIQKQQNVFFILVLTVIVTVLSVPVDSLVWDSSFRMLNGYGTMFAVVEAGILLVTMLTFFVSAYTRGSITYVFIGLGSLLVFVGRNILINSDTWITPLPGLIILAAGTGLISSRLHREYLWL
jgi:hypothetical protein